MWCHSVGDGNWACLVRRRVGKGIQGACAPMAERRGRGGSSAEISEHSEHSEHSEGLADARSWLGASGAGLMAAICLPGEVRRPVPGCYLPGGALGMLSIGISFGT